MADASCPSCGAPAEPGAERCAYCRAALPPGPPSDPHAAARAHFAKGLHQLSLAEYALAQRAFEAALRANTRSADAYAHLALALLAGRHPRTLALGVAREIARHANAALALDGRHAIATAVLALVVREYFEGGSVRHEGPTAEELCQRLGPLMTPAVREALRPHVRTSDALLTKTLLA